MKSVGILGLGHYLPPDAKSSREVEQAVNEKSQVRIPSGWLETLTGVQSRCYASNHEASSDLAVLASLNAIKDANVPIDEIDTIIFAAASQDVTEPATANIVQEKLCASEAHVLDVKNACNSFLNALDLGGSAIATGRSQLVLVCTGEVLSPVVKEKLQSVRDLARHFAGLTLGDAGAAVILSGGLASREILPAAFASDGSYWAASSVPSGGTWLRGDFSRFHLECDSAALMRAALSLVPKVVGRALRRVGWSIDDVSWFVPHQVSRAAIDRIAAEIGVPSERCIITLDRFGNTGAASIPLALSSVRHLFQPDDRILLIGAAAGFSAAALPMVW